MRMPPVSDRIKEAPAQALRGVFAGIGQLLLITDKLRNKTLADQHVPSARVPEPAESVAEADGLTVVQEPTTAGAAEAAGAEATVEAEVTEVPLARKPAERKPAERKPAERKPAQPKATKDDRTGNVRLLPDTGAAAKAASARAGAAVPAEQAASEPPPAVAEPSAAAGAEQTSGVAAVPATTVAAMVPEAPLPNYAELSVASLRARLRNLDIGQVRVLAEYEKAHAGRADVIAMFERRIAKLEAGE